MNFDPLARHYDWLEAFTAGKRLQRVRTCWLDRLPASGRILSAGEGHGRFAAACLTQFPQARLTCVEASAAMLARARRRLGDRGSRVHWECADILDWSPPEKFDALVTCFFLDCFPPALLAEVVAKLASCAARPARWLVADFNLPSHGWVRWRAQAVHGLMYAFFRVLARLPARRYTAPDALLQGHGFRLLNRREYEWGLLRADLWGRP